MNTPPLQAALEAVEAGDPGALRPLLEADPSLVSAPLPKPFSTSPTSIDVGDDGRMRRPLPTLLHRAALGWRESELQVAQLLIDHGGDVNSTEGGALAPLEMAAWSRHPGMAELLIAAGADVELHVEVPPVEVSVLYQRREVFKRLIAAGARYDISHTLRLGMMAETRALLAADLSIVNTETAHGLPLNLAVGKPGIFKLLLRHGADIHAQDSLGLTPLKAARNPESDKEVRALLEMGVEDDIYGALAAGDEARVEAILKADPAQAQPVRCWPRRGPIPPVIWAVWSGSTRILGLILEQDVPLDIRPNPLNTAIGYDYDEMVRMLLDKGASPGCADCSDWPGASSYPPYRPLSLPSRPRPHAPIYKALRGGNVAAVEMLLEAGADPHGTLTYWGGLYWPALGAHRRLMRRLLDRGGDPLSPRAEGTLRWAAQQCRRLMIELLVTHGVDVDTVDGSGKGLLDMVGRSDGRPSREERVKTTALLEELIGLVRGAEREAHLLRLRADLMDAVLGGRIGALRAVQAKAPELFERELVRDDLLHWCAGRGHGDLVDFLAALGAPMTISVAVALGRLELVEAMLTEDPSLVEGNWPPEETDWNKHLPWNQHSPLIVAAMKDRTEVAALLLDRGAGIDRKVGWYQTTALHHAVDSESTETVRLLLERGADVTIRSRDHHLPTALVKNWPPTVSRRKISDLLIAHGANPKELPTHGASE
ncbi:MAG: ankyrin repeat domain-containing protein [Gemmatimonadaceae bacterium]|nr:ankyrin repeat domain-containing protein [Gemmatimonadaceae bacterium]